MPFTADVPALVVIEPTAKSDVFAVTIDVFAMPFTAATSDAHAVMVDVIEMPKNKEVLMSQSNRITDGAQSTPGPIKRR